MSGEARARILARLADALEGREPARHPGALPSCLPGRDPEAPPERASGPDPGAGRAVEVFARAFRRAGGEVVLLPDREAASEWLGGFAVEHASAAVAADVEAALRPTLPEAPPAEAALGVSRAVGAAADTGTLLLDSRRGRGLQLLPPTHLVWVDAAAVRASLVDAMDHARRAGLPPVLALHSGPSKSADIGQIVVTGVHGPGRVVAAVLGAAPPASTGPS